jgi:hypothetical protein
MPLLHPNQYVVRRQAYNYSDSRVSFFLAQTRGLRYFGQFTGIFPQTVPATHASGVNLAKFELICTDVFDNCMNAHQSRQFGPDHLENLKAVVYAIVHWKMASQGGRAVRSAQNVINKWGQSTHHALLSAFNGRSLAGFKIAGIRIPTASAFMRFLFPGDFGVIDRRVVTNWTQPHGITSLSLRSTDQYINDTSGNSGKYLTEYMPFLRSEASWLCQLGVTFVDHDEHGNRFNRNFRPCDVEMALF